MQRVIEPLNENYKRIQIRATELENLISPFPSFVKNEYILKAYKNWTNLWCFIQSYLLKPENLEHYLTLFSELQEEFPRIRDIESLTRPLFTGVDRKPLKELVTIQNELVISYEVGDYLIDFWWKLDCVCLSDSQYFLADIKTASWKWKKWYEYDRYQCVFYTALLSEAMWIYEWDIEFQYWIFNKKTWKLDIRTRNMSRKWAINELQKHLSNLSKTWRLDYKLKES